MLPESPFLPTDPAIAVYDYTMGFAYPREFSGWKEEVLSWKESCYLHAGLNPTQTFHLSGPDATRMLNAICTNNVARLRVGSSTHAIMCAETGNVMAHGMLLRLAENEYMAYWLGAPLEVHARSGIWDVVGEDLTGKRFLFQVAGPRALEVMEAALGESLRDIPFLGHRPSEIGGRTVGIQGAPLSVLRVGMGGSLGYEVHGEIQDAHAVYSALLAAGEPFGIERLGLLAYVPTNHTENGFPQVSSHFLFAYTEDENVRGVLSGAGWPMSGEPGQHWMAGFSNLGSLEGDATSVYCNPIELGWGHLVSLDHEFVGREALAPLKQDPTHKMVTLEWNAEDVLDTFRSHFEEGEEYRLMQLPTDPMADGKGRHVYVDAVHHGDRVVGRSMGRIYSYSYRKMVSLCSLAVDLAAEGTEVEIIWGLPGTRQKRVRATVTRYPLFDLPRNEHIDVTALATS